MTRTQTQESRRTFGVPLIHRISAVVFGVLLWIFAGVGLASRLEFFSPQGQQVLGMSSNGALALLSVVAGAVLLGAGLWGGRIASTIITVAGVLFLLSGLVHLAVINTGYNLLAFRLSNVFFSLIVGMILLFTGVYGRVSGGLPPDNPYRREHPLRSDRPHPEEQLAQGSATHDETDQATLEAEIASAEGHPTAEQADLIRQEQARRRAEERDRAYRQYHGSTGE